MNGEIPLSRKVDEFVPKTRWIVSLSNGETIFEDHRKNVEPCWARLKDYVIQQDVSITGMRVEFNTGLHIKIPSGQEGYVQKKKAWLTPGGGGLKLCAGHVQQGKALIHEVSSAGDSQSNIVDDPGPPWTIYRKDIRDARIQSKVATTE